MDAQTVTTLGLFGLIFWGLTRKPKHKETPLTETEHSTALVLATSNANSLERRLSGKSAFEATQIINDSCELKKALKDLQKVGDKTTIQGLELKFELTEFNTIKVIK